MFILLLYFSRDVHQIWADAAMVELQKKLVKARGTQMLHLKSFEILKDKVRFIKCNSERRRRNTFFRLLALLKRGPVVDLGSFVVNVNSLSIFVIIKFVHSLCNFFFQS